MCTALNQVTMGKSVSVIESESFAGCSSLTQITLPESLTLIGERAFQFTDLQSVTLPGNTATIGLGVFSYNKDLASVKIQEGVVALGPNVFYSCTALTSVTLPESLLYMDYQVFSGCSNLAEINAPSNIRFIGHDVFKRCKKLTEVPAVSTDPNCMLPERCIRLAAASEVPELESVQLKAGEMTIDVYYTLYNGFSNKNTLARSFVYTTLDGQPYFIAESVFENVKPFSKAEVVAVSETELFVLLSVDDRHAVVYLVKEGADWYSTYYASALAFFGLLEDGSFYRQYDYPWFQRVSFVKQGNTYVQDDITYTGVWEDR